MTELIPLPVLFGNPQRVQPALSPDGTQLAWIAPQDGVLNVWVAPVNAERDEGVDWPAARVVTADTDRGIRTFTWAHDGRHLLYLQDSGGDENWRLYDVDLVTGIHRDLTPFGDVQAQILATDQKFPTDVLVGLNRDDPRLHDVYRLDLVSGELVKVETNPGFARWVPDSTLTIRGGVRADPVDGSQEVLVRDTADAPWRTLFAIPEEDALTTGPLTFSEDGRYLLARSSLGTNTSQLVRIEVATGDTEVLVGDPEADLAGVRVHPVTREPQIAVVLKARAQYVVLDPALEPDLAAIQALHPGDPVFLRGDNSDLTWLVGFNNDTGSITYFSYDRTSHTGRFLFEARPELSRYTLAPMEPFSFTSRDGLTIHGYLTFPAGVERSGLPMVLYVHGGPWARDTWGYEPTVQWLANRGYLCVQVNFRSSTGYGKAFINAGDREWGGKMQDDLTDAVRFVTGQGWADPDRVGIYGGSYGGYAALAGAAFTPDLYRCAVDGVGPSNLKTLIETIPPYWAPLVAQFHRRVGNPQTDAEFLWSRSPLSRASSIRIPILVVQGANDPRVKQAEAEQIVAALREAGVDHEYLLFPDEGHGMAKPQNRLRFQATAERFLAKHLGGRNAEAEAGGGGGGGI